MIEEKKYGGVIYPCENCKYFETFSLFPQVFKCHKQELEVKLEWNDNNKGCMLLLIYCPLKEEVKE